jgi:hypothetical protein
MTKGRGNSSTETQVRLIAALSIGNAATDGRPGGGGLVRPGWWVVACWLGPHSRRPEAGGTTWKSSHRSATDRCGAMLSEVDRSLSRARHHPAPPDRSWKELRFVATGHLQLQVNPSPADLGSRPLSTLREAPMAASLGFGGSNVSNLEALEQSVARPTSLARPGARPGPAPAPAPAPT